MWKEMWMRLRQSVTEAAVATAPAFKHLSTINVDYVATGELIWEIAKHCRLLQDLSLYVDTSNRRLYSKRFEDDLIMSLSGLYGHKKTTYTPFRGKAFGCPKLQRLVLPLVQSLQNLYEAEAEILKYLTRMKEIRNGSTTKAMEILIPEHVRKPFSLTHIEDEDAPQEETINHMLMLHDMEKENLLPKVISAKVRQDKERGGLHYLSIFPGLKVLEVFAYGELELSVSFSNITHFKSTCKWDHKKLVSFSRKAPNLEVFVLTDSSISRHKNFKDSMSFPSLRAIEFYGMGRGDPEPVTALLKGAKCLTHLIIGDEGGWAVVGGSWVNTPNLRIEGGSGEGRRQVVDPHIQSSPNDSTRQRRICGLWTIENICVNAGKQEWKWVGEARNTGVECEVESVISVEDMGEPESGQVVDGLVVLKMRRQGKRDKGSGGC
ncbi:hypothetical protein Pmani_028465 [Petrolisthes manimaculis]|uniref:Uncharacterized protein n=1 Tax=Petrolisthes manimaculis TaxID=1843537 RepID=A0AAE1P030_9EUCA|nr:hypothetical protein Pmani_028465 [Petrolisthes manimaculis]